MFLEPTVASRKVTPTLHSRSMCKCAKNTGLLIWGTLRACIKGVHYFLTPSLSHERLLFCHPIESHVSSCLFQFVIPNEKLSHFTLKVIFRKLLASAKIEPYQKWHQACTQVEKRPQRLQENDDTLNLYIEDWRSFTIYRECTSISCKSHQLFFKETTT